ncbi:MAG: hypothetical protein CMQ29_11385 [Gammaproteobacteria bacterium]|nr:hypothetical protein [Gammaproteobacteria bacterium]
MGYKGNVNDPGMDRAHGVMDVYLKRAAPYRGGVDVLRVQTEVLGNLAGRTYGKDALDIADRNTRQVADVAYRRNV